MMNKSGIYKITSTNTAHFYIGSSHNLSKRKSDHFSLLKRKQHPNKYLQRVFDKYQDLSFEVIEECTTDLLIVREQHYIDTLKPKYNLRPVAESNRGWSMPEEARQKISIRNKGKKLSEEHKKVISDKNKIILKGRKLSEQHIESIRKARTGWKLSEATKNKIREKAIGRDIGKLLSQETKDKIGKAFSKKVYQYSLENVFIQEFSSCSEAFRATGISNSSIASCCRGKRKSAGNYKWYYEKIN